VDQLQSIHAAGHIDVREQYGDVRSTFQNVDRLVCMGGLNGFKTGFLDDIHHKHPQQDVVFHDQNDGQ